MEGILKMFFLKKNKWPNLSIDEIRKRARILVIDDSDFFYLQLFKDDSYTIEKWDDVNDLQKLESGYFDIVLLDIQGIGKKQSKDQGFGILKHINQTCPAQIVIAYSNANFSLKYHDFFKNADAILAKTADYVEFKRTVDKLLVQRFSMGFYVDRIAKLASPYLPPQDINKVKTLSEKAILNGKTDRFKDYLQSNIDNEDKVEIIIQIVNIAILIAKAAL